MYGWLIIAATVAVGVTVGVIRPSFSRLRSTTAAILKTMEDNSLSEATATNLIQAKGDTASLQTDLKTLQTAFIQEQNPLPYLTQLEDRANANSVGLSFDVKEDTNSTTAKGQVKPVLTTITVIGSWPNVIAFINDVMVQPIYFVTQDIKFSTATDTTTAASTDVTATLTGQTYWQ